MNTHTYFRPPFTSIEEVEEYVGGFDEASTLKKVADCPRKYEVLVRRGLEPSGQLAMPKVTGIAVHAGLEYYYSLPSELRREKLYKAKATEIVLEELERFEIDYSKADKRHRHKTPDFLQMVMEHYFHHWTTQAIEPYSPILTTLDDLDLTDVLAARFTVNDYDQIVLGESALVMEFDIDGETLYLAGKPDLPVVNETGTLYAMDHKTTSSSVGDWHAKNFQTSNQLRGYMAMLWKLLGKQPKGAIINAIYVGQYPKDLEGSTRTFFDRYVFNFDEDHIDEALRNQLLWKKTAAFYESEGYWPQACEYGGCDMPDLCRIEPLEREDVIFNEYQESDRHFWTL